MSQVGRTTLNKICICAEVQKSEIHEMSLIINQQAPF